MRKRFVQFIETRIRCRSHFSFFFFIRKVFIGKIEASIYLKSPKSFVFDFPSFEKIIRKLNSTPFIEFCFRLTSFRLNGLFLNFKIILSHCSMNRQRDDTYVSEILDAPSKCSLVLFCEFYFHFSNAFCGWHFSL